MIEPEERERPAVIVQQFGDELKKAVVAVAATAESTTRRIALRWFVMAILFAVVIAGVVSWAWPIIFADPVQEFRIRRGDSVETCVRVDAPPDSPLFVCTIGTKL